MMAQVNKSLDDLYQALCGILSHDAVLRNERLQAHTTFEIGGPADIFVEPSNLKELSEALHLIKASDVPLTILGAGSNVLVRDGGIRGVVLSLCKMKHVMSCEANSITAGAGYLLKDVSEYAYSKGLGGLEFAIGIPGSLGGAIFMNAGAYDGEMSQVVAAVTAVTLDGNIVSYEGTELDFAYRHSRFHDSGEIVAEVRFHLQPRDSHVIKQRMDELTEKREAKQPLEYPSAGSTFKRPVGYYAGTLIEETGLKGFSVGNAAVSKKHAGFVINKGNACASDVLGLIAEVQRRVKEAHNVELEPEVRILGEDKP